jgi:ubiquitin-protein ligase
MLSIISLLSAPNFESPADVESSILYKKNYEEYKNIIYNLVSKTQNII